MKKVIFIVGPTASGKTSLSVELAKRFDGEIICADSMQIYKGIHIASASPDSGEQSGIPHRLFEFLELTDSFSVADYVALARKEIEDVAQKGKLPIIVGGTGLYISSLLDNTKFSENKVDPELRREIELRFDALGGEVMLEKLAEFDPESAQRLHFSDKRRIVRCFEIYESTGKTLTQQNEESHKENADFESLVIGVSFEDRQKLYDRIDLRVDLMLKAGLLEEAKSTLELSSQKGAFQAIGHKELYGFLKGECSLEEAVELLKRQTRRYAKRQLTWFRRDGRINWLFADKEDVLLSAESLTKDFLN